MKKIGAAMLTHLGSGNATLASCWLVKRVDGTVLGFTGHDEDIVFDLETWLGSIGIVAGPGISGTGAQTYASSTGYTATDIDTTSALNVDTMELQGILTSPSITESDLNAGLWDFAAVCVFQVNYNDLTMGAIVHRVGHMGEVTLDRGGFKAEMRGLMEAYTRSIGEITSPTCRADLGDSRCKVDLSGGSPMAFTVTGTIEAVNPDLVTLYDSARTEPGPTGGLAVSFVSNANPGVVTLAVALPATWAEGTPITISGVTGMFLVNGNTVVRNPSGATFQLGIDTSDTGIYLPYGGGGEVIELGSNTGFFDYGLITFTSGANTGLSMEVKNYTPGVIVLQLPMPYVVLPGDAYTMHAGCDKSLATCRDRFNNVVNMRAEPYLPGVDRIIQVGRHNG